MTPNHTANMDEHRRRFAPWWSPAVLRNLSFNRTDRHAA
jgi:hypothetical protein